MTRRLAEDKSLMIPFCFQCGCGALAGHDPIVVRVLRVFGAQIIFRDVRENPQGLWLAGLDQLCLL